MLLIIIFVELRVAAGRSRKSAGNPQAVSRRPCCAVALRGTAWSEHGMVAAWAWHAMSESAFTVMSCVVRETSFCFIKLHFKTRVAHHLYYMTHRIL
jgi:hypothetical protein